MITIEMTVQFGIEFCVYKWHFKCNRGLSLELYKVMSKPETS